MEYDRNGALLGTAIESLPKPKRGKVRDIYDLEDSLLFIATDRISAFDVVMPNGIPDKGRVLTSLSVFWFQFFDWFQNHLITTSVDEYPRHLQQYKSDLEGRSMLVKKTRPLPVECVSRGYLIGSGWKDYQKTGSICGIDLPPGFSLADKLDTPIFTPAYKADQGDHDENIAFADVIRLIGSEPAAFVRDNTLKLYSTAADFALKRGIIIADTKFEYGILDDEIILIDEALTPDSSRFWPAEEYEPGKNPPSLDKQFVRDYLESVKWDKSPPAPDLPDKIVAKTRVKYLQAYEQLTGQKL
jgi:phosphoribosylaminoimidazole-succinocarboxamide synthase